MSKRADRRHLSYREEFDELKQDVKIIKAAVIDQGKQLPDHERRISDLEAA